MMTQSIIGWDIGGAHVKVAHLTTQGQIEKVYQLPCPLWKGLAQLQQAVTQIQQDLPVAHYCHAITMTGELVDLFANRAQGVEQIIACLSELLGADKLAIFAGTQGFLPVNQINSHHYETIASANWLASASFAAQQTNGLFIDIGSTTTDILLLQQGQVKTQAYTDYQRLISQELVYTGVVRTAVMALTDHAIDQGNTVGLMAEYFATMADVYRVTGELNETHDQTDTADGAEKTVLASARRLSRMIGCDFIEEELPRWQQFAQNLRVQQVNKIYRACLYRLSLVPELSTNAPLIGAGVGQFLLPELAELLGRSYIDFANLCPKILAHSSLSAADCAPAVAVACLLQQDLVS